MRTHFRSLGSRLGASAALVVLTLFAAFTQPVRTAPAEALAPATAVTFTVLATSGSGTFTFQVNGENVGNLALPTNGGTCTPPLRTFTTTDPAVLALLGDGPTDTCVAYRLGMLNSTNTLLAWVRADITRGATTQSVCIHDTNGGSCNVNDLCTAGYTTFTNQTFSVAGGATGSDADGDGQVDTCDTTNNNAVVAVPWLGSEALAHQVTPGGSVVLQAVASNTAGNAVPLTSATWDPGDGSGPQAIPFGNSLVLEKTHTYNGVVGQPFTAVVTATDTSGAVFTDSFRVVIAANNRETRANMAIDRGLWNLHKKMIRTVSDGAPSAYWVNGGTAGNFLMATTAGVVQAFEINNHRESGDPARNPYVRNVQRGLRYILSQEHGILTSVNIGAQAGPTGYAATAPWPVAAPASNNPDSNGNGYGLYINYSGHAPYLGGQLIDALVASGTPNKTAETGQVTTVRGRTYAAIVQDLLDGYAWGFNDSVGGWHYNYNAGDNDTSSSHWWAIGDLAAQVWGQQSPDWLKNIQWNVGVPRMQIAPAAAPAAGCYFGYTTSYTNHWGDNQMNVTAAGLVLMNADGVPQSNPRYQCAMRWLDNNFTTQLGNYYTMYQVAKAMRTSLDDTGATAPIELLNGTRDWYAAYADYLIGTQNPSTGAFPSTVGNIGSYIAGDMATSWAIIILSPSLFELPPTAACTASPSTLGTNGGLVQFSAAGSFHPDPDETIVSYSWDFGDGSPAATGLTTTHTYTNPGTFPTTRNAQVTVTDSNGISVTSSCAVTIVDTNVPPNPVAGGPYEVCLGSSVTLNGSASADEDGTIVAYKWSWGPVINFNAPNATTATVDATAAFTTLGPGLHNVGLQVTDNDGAVSAQFTTVLVRAASDPACNQAPSAINDAASTFSGTAVTVNVLGNDTDPDSDPLAVTGTSGGPANGSVVVNGGTTVTYTPNLGFAGTDTFTYAVSDGQGGTASASVTITVTKRTASVTAGSGTKVYGSSDPTFTPTSTGFLGGDNIVVTQAARDAGEAVGTYATHATAAGAKIANYTVTYTDGTLTITQATAVATATGGTFTYDGQAYGGTCSVAGVNGEVLAGVISYSSGGAPVVAGTHTVTCNFAGTNNYAATSATATIVIDKAAASVTAGSGTKVYGAADPTLTPTATGFVAGDNIVVTQTARDAGETVGTYATHATAAGMTSAALANYDVTYNDGTLEITPAAAVATATGATVTYDGQAHGGTCTVAGVNGEVLTGAISYSTGGEPVSAGSHTVTCDFAATTNYTASSSTAPIVINKAAASVTAGSGTKVYGTGDPTFTPTSSGFLGADNIVVTQVARDAGEGAGTYATHATAAGAALDNYAVTYNDGTLEITKASATATATGGTFVYDGQPHGGTCAVAPVTGSDVLTGSISYSSGGEPVAEGSYTVTCTFAGTPNYNATSGTATIVITQGGTVTAIAAPTVTYMANGLVTVTVSSASGVVPGLVSLTVDGTTTLTATLSGGSATFVLPSPNAGNHALVATYLSQGNFSGSSATGTLQVNPSPTSTTLTTSATPQLAGTPVTFTATVTSVAPGSGTPNGVVTFMEGATVLGTGTLNASGVATFTTTTLSNGPHTITAVYNGVNNYLTSTSTTVSKLIFGLAAGGGTFVIGDNNAALNSQVMFWGAQWEKNNSMTGGSSNNSFKGYAIAPGVPAVGQTFTAAPGNSAPSPSGVPQYLGIIVTSKVTKAGSTISGTIVKLVVVQVDPGYQGNPGHAGTGKVVAFVQ